MLRQQRCWVDHLDIGVAREVGDIECEYATNSVNIRHGNESRVEHFKPAHFVVSYQAFPLRIDFWTLRQQGQYFLGTFNFFPGRFVGKA